VSPNDAPQKIGSYTLLRLLAEGGMAEVWLARKAGPLGVSKLVVVKRILSHQARNRDFVDAFIDEARLTVRLQHPNIVQVLEVGEEQGRPFLALELVDGLDLDRLWHELARRGRPLPIGVAAHIAAGLLRALDYAHALSDEAGQPLHVVHRDISPPNILLGRHGEVKLADFGIARARGRLAKTAFGLVKGKAAYMSPEQAAGLPLDGRSDLFAVGVILWESLTGARLFDAGDDFATMRRAREAQVAAPSTKRSEIDPALDAIVLRLLAKNPADRYPRAKAAMAALEATDWFRQTKTDDLAVLVGECAGEPLSKTPPPTKSLDLNEEPAVAALEPPLSKSRRLWIAGAVALAVLLAAVGLWRWTNPPSAPASHAPNATVEGASLIVNPGTPGAMAFWDGRPLNQVPLAWNLPFDKRSHELTLLRPGYAPWRRNMSFTKTRVVDQKQTLARLEGFVSIIEGEWTIAGRRFAPGEIVALPAGSYLAERQTGEHRLVTVPVNQTFELR
jgi:serine/threonine protein kinase